MVDDKYFDALRDHLSLMPETGIPDVIDIKPETYMLVMRIGVCFATDTADMIQRMLLDGAPDPAYLLDIAGQCLRFYEYLDPVYEELTQLSPVKEENGFSNLLRSMLEEGKEPSEG